jgi:hypothetical protein
MPKGVYLYFPKSEFRPPEFHPSLMFAYVVVIDLIQHIVSIAYTGCIKKNWTDLKLLSISQNSY